MPIESNTERFLALKKLSELKAEYHKSNLMELAQLGKKYKNIASKAESIVSTVQMAFKLFHTFHKK